MSKQKINKNVILLGFTSLFTDISSEMIYPLLPLFLTGPLGASAAVVGIIEGIAESIASLLKVFSGALSDWWQRRKPLAIAGYSSSAIGKAILYLASVWPVVLVARVVDRFGKGIRTAPRDALIADSVEKGIRGRSFGLHRAMDTLGAVIGVSLAIFIFSKWSGNFRLVFLLSIIPAIIGIVCLTKTREIASSHPRQVNNKKSGTIQAARTRIPSFKDFGKTWRRLDRKLKAFLIITFIFTLGNSSNQFLLLRARNTGFGIIGVLALYLLYNVVYMCVSYPAGRFSDLLGPKKILVMGYLVYGVTYFAFAFLPHAGWLWLSIGIYGLYMGLTQGVEKALVSDMAPQEVRATLIGLHSTLVGIGLFPASVIAGLLWDAVGPYAPFILGGCAGIGAALALAVLI